ncbi:chemotaxis protein CheB [Limimaricola pyoseonensis]|uniref:Two-component system, chemotaxis family, CheB/CheR fusion protein n=1 Tax=Limimaricola pyoseonensis TaxID=521013 RepID=A0A1G6ZNV4_9RHOB|nr:chemotaxis protein CheB [Limimaricola pyoseonensis]SDE04230.1 two-component system, chemotaxis family, CheB/CheR fusion protein [Limimaricola pyoseonensis]
MAEDGAGNRADNRAETTDTALPVVGIGASAGGLEALREMLSEARLPTGMAYVVVQHLDPNHDSLLAELLSRHTALTVRQAEAGERVQPDHVYIIPPGHGLEIAGGALELTPFAEPRGLRRPIDDFFVSLGEDARTLSACVILSGTGADGTLGLRAVKENGGLALVQAPETARYDGMPRSAVGTGLVDFVLRPSEILPRLRDYFARAIGGSDTVAGTGDQIDEICEALHEQTGHDFSGYKHTTLARRIQRRMQVMQIEDPSRYRSRLRGDRTEARALLRDLLINVTRFFRDPEHFEALRETVIAPMVAAARDEDDIRVWVPGCSSGEEAYSIAMLFAEECRAQERAPRLQIFATDIDEQMLEIAREGRYLTPALPDIPEALRDSYTIQHGDHFRIAPQLREMIRFSPHSVIKDPPFSRLSLISCRNLFIYFGERLQSGVLPIFHYALEPEGVLFLGPSESIGRHEEMFAPLDHKARIFRRGETRGRYPIELPAARSIASRAGSGAERWESRERAPQPGLALQRLAERYARPCVVLDRDGTMIESHGRLGRYFEFSAAGGGAAAQAARPGLREVLMPLMREALDNRRRVISRDIEVRAEFGRQRLDVIADPLADETVLLVFRDTDAFEAEPDDDLLEIGPSDGQVEMLEGELRHTRRQLRDKTEQLETANEELKSSNEEMMSMNEELQSTNEELSTVNDELKVKVDQLSVANDDLKNFFDSTRLPVVVLDGDMRLRSYTEAALAIFPLQPGDKGRPLSHVSSLLADDGFLDAARRVVAGEEDVRLRIAQGDGTKQWMLNVRPYRLLDGRRDGATLVFSDITEVLALQDQLGREREQLELALRLARIGIWDYSPETGQISVDSVQAELLGLTGAGSHPVERLLARIVPQDREAMRDSLETSLSEGRDFAAELRLIAPQGERPRHLRSLGRLVSGRSERRMIGVTFDVTADRHAAETRELMIREMNHRVKNLFAVISALVTTTARGAADKEDLAASLRGKIAGLGRAHALTNDLEGLHGVPFGDLVAAMLEPYAGQVPLSASGPAIEAEPQEVTPLALILHEWATNAAKYGALRDGDGSLDISWEAQGDGGWRLIWRETKPAHDPASGSAGGFGSRLVEISARQLGAELDNRRDGTIFEWTLTKHAHQPG